MAAVLTAIVALKMVLRSVEKGPALVLSQAALLGLFFIQRYRFLTIT